MLDSIRNLILFPAGISYKIKLGTGVFRTSCFNVNAGNWNTLQPSNGDTNK